MAEIPESVVNALAEEGFTVADIEGLTMSIDDARWAGFCATGMRSWMDSHGLSIKALVDGELPAEDLAATGDAYAIKAIIGKLKRGL